MVDEMPRLALFAPIGLPYEIYMRRNVIMLHEAGWSCDEIATFFFEIGLVAQQFTGMCQHMKTTQNIVFLCLFLIQTVTTQPFQGSKPIYYG